jgi:uncharacterized RDD family membrane protein YckC
MQFHPKDLSELEELTEEHLGFSALSDGLGFSKSNKPNPAAKEAAGESRNEGITKSSMSGIGATAAGPAYPSPNMFSPTKPTFAMQSASTAIPSVAKTAASTLSMPAASPLLRLAAFGLDFGIVFFPLLATWFFSFGQESVGIFLQNPKTPSILFAIIFVVYFLMSESFGGQSLGKMAMGLQVVEDDKYEKPTRLNHAIFRLVLLVIGTALGGMGLWMSFRDSKLRPWQDRYSGTIVRKKS